MASADDISAWWGRRKGPFLKALTVISSGSSALDISTELRQWRRCFQRAREIGAALPDGTLLVHALEAAAGRFGKIRVEG